MEERIGNISYVGNLVFTLLASVIARFDSSEVTMYVAIITGFVSIAIGVVAFISHITKTSANIRLSKLAEAQHKESESHILLYNSQKEESEIKKKLTELEAEIASTRLQKERMDWELTKKCMDVMMPDVSKASEKEKPIKPE